MKTLRRLVVVLLLALLAGCTSSQPVATSTDPARDTSTTTATTEAVPASDTASGSVGPAPTRAPQDWYHLARVPQSGPGLDTRQAYRRVLQNRPPRDTVQVAIIDSGVDVGHEDLRAQAWTNADEVPGNGVDDDDNGYVDDVHGWNFIGGPGGKNVNQDTYELTRIYVDLRERFGDADSADVAPAARSDYQRFLKIKKKFQRRRNEAEEELTKIRTVRDRIDIAEKILKNHLGTDTLTQDAVASISSQEGNVPIAQNLLMNLYRQDISTEDLQEYLEQLQRQVEYNYNPDFNPRPLVGDDYSDKTEWRYGNNDVAGPDPQHGTHVAGIVGATRDNGIGLDGIARGIQLMAVRAVPNGDERDKDVANAIRYAVNNGADVINMSFGKGYSPHKEVVDAAVQYADSMGVLMIHAAGNDAVNVDSTENYPSRQYENGDRAQLWIEVGASSWKGDRQLVAPFSNYGAESVDLFAPGHSIYSTIPNDRYDRSDGTSMAAPMVTGLSALIMAYFPSLTPSEVRSIILNTATSYRDRLVQRPGGPETIRFGQLSRTGAVANAHAALQRAQEMTASQ